MLIPTMPSYSQMYAYDYFIYSLGYRLGRGLETQNFDGDGRKNREK